MLFWMKRKITKASRKLSFGSPKKKTGKLSDSFGAWKMTDQEEQAILGELSEGWSLAQERLSVEVSRHWLAYTILRGKQEAHDLVAEIEQEPKAATTSINAFEVFYVAFKSQLKAKTSRKPKNYTIVWRLCLWRFLLRGRQLKFQCGLQRRGSRLILGMQWLLESL